MMNRITHVSVRSARDMSASSFIIGALREDIKADRVSPEPCTTSFPGPGIE